MIAEQCMLHDYHRTRSHLEPGLLADTHTAADRIRAGESEVVDSRIPLPHHSPLHALGGCADPLAPPEPNGLARARVVPFVISVRGTDLDYHTGYPVCLVPQGACRVSPG